MNTRLGIADALDETNAFEHLGQLGEIGGAQFGEQVPAPVRVMQRGDACLAQQAGNDAARLIALHGDAHPRLDVVGLRIRPQPNRVADYDT
jgi:hypothetical protein